MVEHLICNQKVAGSIPAGGCVGSMGSSPTVSTKTKKNKKKTKKSKKNQKFGRLAQMVERALCMREAGGSMPSSSTS